MEFRKVFYTISLKFTVKYYFWSQLLPTRKSLILSSKRKRNNLSVKVQHLLLSQLHFRFMDHGASLLVHKVTSANKLFAIIAIGVDIPSPPVIKFMVTHQSLSGLQTLSVGALILKIDLLPLLFCHSPLLLIMQTRIVEPPFSRKKSITNFLH